MLQGVVASGLPAKAFAVSCSCMRKERVGANPSPQATNAGTPCPVVDASSASGVRKRVRDDAGTSREEVNGTDRLSARCSMVGMPAGIWGTAAELIFPDNSSASDRSFRNYRRIPREETEAVETVIRSLRYNHDRTDPLDERLQQERNHFRNTGIEWPAAPPGSEPAGRKRRNRECLPERDQAPDEAAWPALGNGRGQGHLDVSRIRSEILQASGVENLPPPENRAGAVSLFPVMPPVRSLAPP